MPPSPPSSTPSLFSAVVILLLFTGGNLTTPLPQPQDVFFPDCNRTFSCGPVQNVTYPFTGGDRPDYCGPPEFRLTCRDNYPELTTNSFTYRVLQLNPNQQTLILARLDLWNNTCPQQFINTTLNSTIFTSGDDNEDLTLFYDCGFTLLGLLHSNRFYCNASGVSSTDSYYLIGPVSIDPILNIIQCSYRVRLPILKVAGADLSSNELTLGEALTQGFSVNYVNPYDSQCLECTDPTGSGGQCGFDANVNRPICICDDRLCLPPGSVSGKRSTIIIVAPVVGAAVAGIGIGLVVFFLIQRRKRRAAESARTESKDLPTPLSSKGPTTTPSTNFTRSIPSYPSSKSEFGKSTYFGVQVFSYAELEEATDNFDTSKELGDGGFGTVYYGILVDGREVAVKRLYENNFKRVEQFMNEVEILTRLHHENLVKLYGCTSKRSRELLLVYEYIPNGTVADHLHGKQANSISGLLSWPVRLNIAIETANALAYLHESDIIHRDVKTNNILLDKNFHVKVADFGLSRLFDKNITHVSTAPQGTPGYVDPEYYRCYQLTDKSDVYSFGVVLIELISSLEAVDTNRHRHDINLANMAVNKIQNHMLHELVDKSLGFETDNLIRRMTTLVAELAFRCLQQEKDMRPSMKEVLEILRGIQNEEFNPQKAEVLDIVVDDGKDNLSPSSPESGVTEKLVDNSVPNSSG